MSRTYVILRSTDWAIDELDICEGVLYNTLVSTSKWETVTMYKASIVGIRDRGDDGWALDIRCEDSLVEQRNAHMLKSISMWGTE